MILSLLIDKVNPGQFFARLQHDKTVIGKGKVHSRITDAIDWMLDIADDTFGFVEIRYGSVSSGTIQRKTFVGTSVRDLAVKLIAMDAYVAAREVDRNWAT